MKRKIIALALTCAMLCGMTVTAHAEDTILTDNCGEYSADTTVVYTENSHYTVCIPQTLDACMVTSENPYYFTAQRMELDPDVHVAIITDNSSFSMVSDRGITMNCYINTTKSDYYDSRIVGYFTDGQTTSEQGFYIELPNEINTGSYTGTVTFQIGIHPNR